MIVFQYLLKMVIFIFQFYFVLHYFIQYQIIFCSINDPGVIPRPNADEILQTEKEYNIQTDL